MSDKPKIGPELATVYLEKCRPELMLGKWLGGGGFGDVYELRGGPVPMVVKIMDTRQIVPGETNAMIKRQRKEARKNLDEEVKVMEQLKHCPNIMPLMDSCDVPPEETGNDRDKSICVKLLFMPQLVPLNKYIGTGSMDEPEVLGLLRDITAALVACADQQIIHCDLKPDNIFVALDSGSPRYLLGDFGICRRKDAAPQKLSYTPYRAPECISGAETVDVNMDIYSLGVVAYECLEGKRPYPDTAGGLDRQIPVIGHISQDLFDALTLMLQRDPGKRCAHPRNLAEQLELVSRSGVGGASRKEFAPEVRQLILENDLDAAIQAARKGIKNQEISCQRLMSIAAFKRASDRQKGCDKARAIIAELCLEEDMASIFLRGYFAGLAGEWAEYVRDLRIAAEAGFVPGCYLHGRDLLYGDRKDCPQDMELGMQYLVKAAEADYYPALRLLQREYDRFPKIPLSQKLQKRLEEEVFSKTSHQERTALYEWL